MTWKPVRIADLDAKTRREAEENLNFWIGRGLPIKHTENTKTTHQSQDLPQEDPNDWYKQGKECPF